MKAFAIETLMARQAASDDLYLEFLREQSLSMGVYTLPAGSEDPQQPHNEDEVYYILSGRAQIDVDGETRPVQPGNIVFVPAHIPHHFHTIADDLTILVFFAPAET